MNNLLLKYSLFILLLPSSLFCMSPDQKSKFLKKCAPIIFFNNLEKWFPGNVETFIKSSIIQDRKFNVLTSPGQLTIEELLKHNNSTNYIQLLDEKYISGEKPKGHPVQAPCYAHIVEKNNDKAVIQYIFFYPMHGPTYFSNPKYFGAYQGDWKHINVHIQKKVHDFEIEKIFYAQDGNKGEYVDAHKAPLNRDTHPIVYSSRGAHNNYSQLTFKLNDPLSIQGSIWNCEDHIIDIGNLAQPTSGNEWLQFKGSWGVKEQKTPSMQEWWRETDEQYCNIAKIKISDDMPDIETKSFNLNIPDRILKLKWNFEIDDMLSTVHINQNNQKLSLIHKGLFKDKVLIPEITDGMESPVPQNTKDLIIKGILARDIQDKQVYVTIQGIEE